MYVNEIRQCIRSLWTETNVERMAYTTVAEALELMESYKQLIVEAQHNLEELGECLIMHQDEEPKSVSLSEVPTFENAIKRAADSMEALVTDD